MHARGRIREIPERVQEGPLIFADIEGEEAAHAIVSWTTSRGDDGMLGIIRAGEVSRACPLGGGLSHD
jgi:hypothetical protein